MSVPLPTIYLARHGETAWSLTGQHTGLTDLELTERGRRNAQRLGQRLAGMQFEQVLTSPLVRARSTCELAGFGPQAQIDPDLVEWNYGEYEGLTSAEIDRVRPDWQLFRDGCPGGESVEQVCARADRVVAKLRTAQVGILIFSSGHFLRVLAARWIELPPGEGARFYLGTATLSALGYEHNLTQSVLRLWNDARHVGD